MFYVAVVLKAEDDFAVCFPDLPGCIAEGTDLPEARRNAALALADHLNRLVRDDTPFPFARKMKQIHADREYQYATLILVEASAPAASPLE